MRLSKVLLVAGAGVLVYKVLRSVKIVKVDFSEELPQEFELATEVMREVYGKEFAKGFEKAIKDNENKTNIKIDEKLVELFAGKKEDEVEETTDKAKKLIEEYHENYREVTV